MLIINCPFCGPRNESEFMHGGALKQPRPDTPDNLSDNEWINYLTIPPNPVGDIEEKWWHVRGCGHWTTVIRHTVTHEISQPENQANEHRDDD